MARSSTTVAELRRMFSNLDSTVIESVLTANNNQLDLTIDHLLTMSIDTENQSNIHRVYSTLPNYFIDNRRSFLDSTIASTSTVTSCSEYLR